MSFGTLLLYTVNSCIATLQYTVNVLLNTFTVGLYGKCQHCPPLICAILNKTITTDQLLHPVKPLRG